MFEVCIDYCEKALEIDPKHEDSLLKKAKALAFLFEFD